MKLQRRTRSVWVVYDFGYFICAFPNREDARSFAKNYTENHPMRDSEVVKFVRLKEACK